MGSDEQIDTQTLGIHHVTAIARLLALPPEWRAEVLRQAEAMLHPKGANDEQRTQLEARLYADGLLTETEYAAEARAIQELMITLPSPFVEEVDLRTAAALLADMPALLAASPIPEQRGILRGVFDRVWLAAHTISAIMPNRLYLPLASAAAEVCISGGPGGDPASIRTHWLRRRRQCSGRRRTRIPSSIFKCLSRISELAVCL